MHELNSNKAGAMMKGLILSVAMTAAITWTQPVNAACSINIGGPGPSTGTQYEAYVPGSSQFVLSPTQSIIAAPNNPTAGQVLMRMTRPLPTYTGSAQGRATAYYGCVMGTAENFNALGATVSGFTDVYSTGLQGVGYRVAYYMAAGDPSSAVFAPQTYINPFANGVLFYPFGGSSAGPSNLETMIELVATGGPIGLGTISASQVAAQSSVSGAPSTQLYKVSLGSNITIANPTCTTVNQALEMTLPDVSTTTLLQDGEGPKTDLNFMVACTVGSSLSPSITIASPNIVSDSQNVLANISTAPNKAAGVGIEIWLGSPMPGGPYTAPTLGLAYPNYGTAVGGGSPSTIWGFRIGANLKRIGPASVVRAGPVQSTATLTFTYN